MKPIVICLIMINCFVVGAAAQKKIEFDYPEEAVADTAKQRFVKQFNQGHVLYNMACARCHTVTENKIKIIPDFSLPQLLDYEMRIYPEHSDQLGDNKVTDEELARIVLFLRYKKKSGKLVRPAAIQ